MAMRFLTLVLAVITSANASFLRASSQERQRSLSIGVDALSLFGIDPAPFKDQNKTAKGCPEKPCFTVNYFKYINPDILETEFRCTSATNCEFACLYYNTTFACEEDLLDIKDCERCELPCVSDSCEDYKMCLPLSSIENDLVGMNCTKPEDCPLGECRYNDQNQTAKVLQCDDAYGSLCEYHCVEPDSGTLPPIP